MNREAVLAMRARGYRWSEIAPLCGLSTFTCWMTFGLPFGIRAR